jgi:hypothetical protein
MGAKRIEALIDGLAAALFAAAVAFASFMTLRGTWPLRQAAVVSAFAFGLAFLLCARTLRSIAPEARRFGVAAFEVAPLQQSHLDELLLTEQVELLLTEQVELLLTEQVELLLTEQVELVLTEAHRLNPVKPDELVLDDILAELGPDSRVVRLFDPAKMPTPGQLNSRIERHLEEASLPPASPDAAQALYDALAELRRSLR